MACIKNSLFGAKIQSNLEAGAAFTKNPQDLEIARVQHKEMLKLYTPVIPREVDGKIEAISELEILLGPDCEEILSASREDLDILEVASGKNLPLYHSYVNKFDFSSDISIENLYNFSSRFLFRFKTKEKKSLESPYWYTKIPDKFKNYIEIITPSQKEDYDIKIFYTFYDYLYSTSHGKKSAEVSAREGIIIALMNKYIDDWLESWIPDNNINDSKKLGPILEKAKGPILEKVKEAVRDVAKETALDKHKLTEQEFCDPLNQELKNFEEYRKKKCTEIISESPKNNATNKKSDAREYLIGLLKPLKRLPHFFFHSNTHNSKQKVFRFFTTHLNIHKSKPKKEFRF